MVCLRIDDIDLLEKDMKMCSQYKWKKS